MAMLPSVPSVKALTRRLSRASLVGDEDGEVLDRGETAAREGRFVFEAAWEVANKVLSPFLSLIPLL